MKHTEILVLISNPPPLLHLFTYSLFNIPHLFPSIPLLYSGLIHKYFISETKVDALGI